jgi:hypothetical protein
MVVTCGSPLRQIFYLIVFKPIEGYPEMIDYRYDVIDIRNSKVQAT